MKTLTLILITAASLCAQPSGAFIRDLEAQRIERAAHPAVQGRKLWLASIAALAVGNTLDVHSSWGKREMNPLLAGPGGTFGVRGAGLKAGIGVGVVLAERLIFKRDRRPAAAVNFALAGALGAVAKYNYGNRRPQ